MTIAIPGSAISVLRTQSFSNLTGLGAGQIPFADSAGVPTSSSQFTIDPTTGKLKVQRGHTENVRVHTIAGAVTVAVSDYIVVVNKASGAATAANLPASPVAGDVYIIKDGKGDAATNNITVTPAAGTIDGAATYVMSVNYASVTIVYNGTQWNLI